MSCENLPRKFIIDADPGIDDALAIFAALESHLRGEIQILGITLVSGNTHVENQVSNVLRILSTIPECYGNIPVFKGAREGLVHKFEQPPNIPPFHGNNGFGDVIFSDLLTETADQIVQEEHAVLAINRIVHQNPGAVTIVALGPLTNIAMALKLDDSFESKVQELVIMGGNMTGMGNITTAAEFNFYADPESAHVVLNRMAKIGQPVKTKLVTWELCRQSKFSWDWRCTVLAKLPGDRIKLMNILDEAMHKNTLFQEDWSPCDLYAMVVALDQKCVLKSTNYNAVVELQGVHSRGQVILDKRFVIDGSNFGHNLNLQVIEELDLDLVRKQILRAMDPGLKD